MGLLKKIGKGLGGLLKGAAPILGRIPGIGTLGGALLGAGGSILSGGNLSDHLGAAAGGATGGILKRLGIGGGPEIQGITGPTGIRLPNLTGGGGDVGTMPVQMPEGSFGGRLKRLGSRALDWIKEHPDLALAGASGLSGALSARTADRRLKRLDEDAARRFAEGQALLAQDRPVDTSSYIYRR